MHKIFSISAVIFLFYQVLVTIIWLRRYPTIQHISEKFQVPVSSVHRILHRILPLLHVYLVPRYIKWHNFEHWRNLTGTFSYWPRVVAIVDGTPFRINRPKGLIQRLFWRRDRHCFFLNWIVITDVEGFIVLSRPGFVGHISDSTCFRFITKYCSVIQIFKIEMVFITQFSF